MDSESTFKESLQQLSRLRVNSETPTLDARLLMQAISQKNHAWLIVHKNEKIGSVLWSALQALLADFKQGVPMAYLLKQQEFWSLPLTVSPATLIPRPETECLVAWVLENFSGRDSLDVLDLGTGSGAIALALKSEKKCWSVTATDQSKDALTVAQKNAEKLQLQVEWLLGSWWDPVPERRFDCIISNPPYIEAKDPHLPALRYEPQTALVAGDDGLSDLAFIIQGADDHLQDNGWLIVEHGYNQQKQVLNWFESAGLVAVQGHQDLSGQDRFVVGKRRA